MENLKDKKAICSKCKFYYITFDQQNPYGRKSHGFKSKQIPSIIVKQTSGYDCLSFEEKENKSKGHSYW